MAGAFGLPWSSARVRRELRAGGEALLKHGEFVPCPIAGCRQIEQAAPAGRGHTALAPRADRRGPDREAVRGGQGVVAGELGDAGAAASALGGQQGATRPTVARSESRVAVCVISSGT